MEYKTTCSICNGRGCGVCGKKPQKKTVEDNKPIKGFDLPLPDLTKIKTIFNNNCMPIIDEAILFKDKQSLQLDLEIIGTKKSIIIKTHNGQLVFRDSKTGEIIPWE